MTNDERITNDQNPKSIPDRGAPFGIPISDFFCHWVLVIRHSSYDRSCAGAAPGKLWARSLRQLPPVRLGVTPMFLGGGLFVRERFAAQLDVNLLHLPGQTIADITRDAFVLLQGRFDRVN